MTAPQLALGISAPGAAEIIKLAQAVNSLQTGLKQLAAQAESTGVGGLEKLNNEVRAMRQEMVAALNGLRTDLVEGFNKAFTAAQSQVQQGGDKLASEHKRALAKIKVSSQAVDLGGGVKAGVSGSTLESVDKTRELLATIQLNGDAVAAKLAAEQTKIAALRAKGATRMSENDVRAMLGMPSLDDMRTFSASLKAQMNDALKVGNLRARSATRMSENDVRALLGMPSRDEMKTFSASLKAQMNDAVNFGKERVRSASKMDEDATRALLGMPSRAEMSRFKSQLQAEMLEVQRIRKMVSAATMRPDAVFSSLGTGSYRELQNLPKTLDDVVPKAAKAKTSIQGLAGALNDGHSAARGLASGFGAMWLTWGNLLPLLAGAALSHGFVQTIKMGADVSHTMTQIQVLTEQTGQDMGKLEQKLLSLGKNGPVGPQELAKAMKTLALAGLDAGKVYSAINDVLNFAVAGNVTIEQAADVMTTVATVFRITSENYSYVGDTIAKTAALSKTSVEGMGEAFKTASVIGKQYGVTLEDTATGLALLANAGVQNTAAGTALRNMYADLSGRTPKVTKAMEELGVKGIDPVTGKMRKQADVFNDLMKALAQRTPTDQFKYLQTIFSERGEKGAAAILDAMRTKAEQTGKDVLTIYQELQKGIEESSGYAAVAAANLAMTPLNQMKSTAATLQTVLVEAFNALTPVIADMTQKMKAAFNDPEFKSGLTDMVSGVGTLTAFMITHAKEVATVGLAYLGLRGAAGIITGISAATTAWGVQTSAAIGSVGIASRLAVVANPLLLALVSLVTAAAGAWGLYALWAGKGGEANEKIASSGAAKQLLEKLQLEEARLLKVNQARREGISLMELEARIAGDKARNTTPDTIQNARKALEDFDANTAKNNAALAHLPLWQTGKEQTALETTRKRSKLVEGLAAAEAGHAKTLKDIEATEKRIIALSKEATVAGRKQGEPLIPESGSLTKLIENARDKANKAGKSGGAGSREPYDNTLRMLESELQSRQSALKAGYDTERQLLEQKHRGDLISEGAYQASVLNMTIANETKQKELLQSTTEVWMREWDARRAKAKGADLKNLDGDRKRFEANNQEALSKLASESLKRQQMAVNSLDAETKKLIVTNDEYWAKAEAGLTKDLNQSQVRRDLANASAEVRAAAEAEQKVTDQHAGHVEKLTKEYTDAIKELSDFSAGLSGSAQNSEEAQAHYNGLINRITSLGAALELTGTQLDKLKKLAATDATNDVTNRASEQMRRDFEEGSKKIAGDLADAILDGGKDGGRRLKDWLMNYFVREPIRVFLQGVMRPVGNFLQGFAGGGTGGGAMAAGGGSGNSMNTLSQLGSAYNYFGGGGLGVMGTAAAGWAGATGAGAGIVGTGIGTTAAGAGAAFEGYMAAQGIYAASGGTVAGLAGGVAGATGAGSVAAGGAMSGMGATAAAAIPVIGWAIAAIAAIAAISKATKGETRAGGHYSAQGIGGLATFLHGPSGGDPFRAQATSGINATTSGINNLLAGLGSSSRVSGFHAAYEGSEKGRGGVYSGGYLSNGMRFGESGQGSNYNGTLYETSSARTLSAEEAFKNFTTDLKQVTIQALQAVQDTLPKAIRDLLIGVDAESLSDEDATALVTRVSTIIEGVKRLTTMADSTAIQKLHNLSFDIKASLIDIAGGADALLGAIDTYYTNFFSEGERRVQTIKNIQASLGNVGVHYSTEQIGSGTRAQFRAMVDSLDLTTDAGQRAFATMMSLSGAFAQLTEVAEETVSQIDHLAEAKSNLQDAYNREKDVLESLRDRLHGFIEAFTRFRDRLVLGDLSPKTPFEKYHEGRAQFTQLIADIGQGGDVGLAAAARFEEVATSFLEVSKAYNASGPQYQADYANVLAQTANAVNVLTVQETLAVQQLSALHSQVAHLIQVEHNIMTVAHAVSEVHKFMAIDAQNRAAQLAAVAAAASGGGMPIVPVIPPPPPPVIVVPPPPAAPAPAAPPAINLVPGQNYNIGGQEYMWGGQSIGMGAATGGYRSAGRVLVGEEGPEVVDFDTPGRVYTAAKTRVMMSGEGTDQNTLLARIDVLCEEIERLREQHAQGVKAEIAAMYSTSNSNADRVAAGVASATERATRLARQKADATLE